MRQRTDGLPHDGDVHQLAGAGGGQLVAQLDVRQFAVAPRHGCGQLVAQRIDQPGLAGQRQLIQRRHGVARADIAGIDLVVVEVLARQHAVLVADQAILLHRCRIEFHLDLHVARDGGQGRADLADQHLVAFHQVVDIRIGAVAGIGQLLHQLLVVVAGAEAERGQRHAGLALLFHHALELPEVGHAHVEVAVGGQQHAVDAAGDKALLRGLVGQRDATGATSWSTAALMAVLSLPGVGGSATRVPLA